MINSNIPGNAGRMQMTMDSFYSRTIEPYARSLVRHYGQFSAKDTQYYCSTHDLPETAYYKLISYFYEYYGMSEDWFNLLDFIPNLENPSTDNDIAIAQMFRNKIAAHYTPMLQELLDECSGEYWHEWNQSCERTKRTDNITGEIYYTR